MLHAFRHLKEKVNRIYQWDFILYVRALVWEKECTCRVKGVKVVANTPFKSSFQLDGSGFCVNSCLELTGRAEQTAQLQQALNALTCELPSPSRC